MLVKTPQLIGQNFVNLLQIIKHKEHNVVSCVVDLKVVPRSLERAKSSYYRLSIQDPLRQEFCHNCIFMGDSILLHCQFASFPIVQRQFAPVFCKIFHPIYQCFPDPKQKNPTSPTSNTVTLGNTASQEGTTKNIVDMPLCQVLFWSLIEMVTLIFVRHKHPILAHIKDKLD